MTEKPHQYKAVRQHFEEHAEDWLAIYSGEGLNALNIQLRKERVLKLIDSLSLPEATYALDLGCGTGLMCVELLRRGFRVLGVDVAEGMLELARKNCADQVLASQADFRLGNAEQIEFEDASFDLVVAMGLIEYLRWDRWSLQQMLRVLKPGGYLIVTAPNKVRLSRLISTLADPVRMMKRLLLRPLRRCSSQDQMRNNGPVSETFQRKLYLPGRLNRTLDQLGFEVLSSDSHGFGTFPLVHRSNRATVQVHSILQKLADTKRIPFLGRLGNNYNVLCRKREQPEKIEKRSFLVAFNQRIRTFQFNYRKRFGRRYRWLRDHSNISARELRQLKEITGLDEVVLVLSPHPDDEIIGCGGSLLKLAQSGARITVLQLTDGANSAALQEETKERRHSVRLDEASEVARDLGAALVLWKEADGLLERSPENVEKLLRLVESLRPTIIFTPFINECHPDHRATSEILAATLRHSRLNLKCVRVLCYQVWSFVPINVLSDIDELFDQKARLLFKYQTGMKVVDYVELCRSLNAYHAATLGGRKGFAEGFFGLNAKEYLEILPG